MNVNEILEKKIIENYLEEFKEFEPYHYYISQLSKKNIFDIIQERYVQYILSKNILDRKYIIEYLKQKILSLKIFFIGKILHRIFQDSLDMDDIKIEAKVEVIFPSKRIPKYIKISGRADIVDYNNETVYELKTISERIFNEISEPFYEHILQANAYAYILGFKNYSIIYISKSNYVFKEFKLNVKEELYEKIVENANIVAEIEYNVLNLEKQ